MLYFCFLLYVCDYFSYMVHKLCAVLTEARKGSWSELTAAVLGTKGPLGELLSLISRTISPAQLGILKVFINFPFLSCLNTFLSEMESLL